jgi:hypothetical protein
MRKSDSEQQTQAPLHRVGRNGLHSQQSTLVTLFNTQSESRFKRLDLFFNESDHKKKYGQMSQLANPLSPRWIHRSGKSRLYSMQYNKATQDSR